MEEFTLLVSCCSHAMGRARREILTRLRVLGDETPLVIPTGVRGMLEVRTSLEPRQVVGGLQKTCRQSPQAFRYTLKWMPVDAWTPADLESMKQAVFRLSARIEANETWRMTVEKRAPSGVLDPSIVIQTLAMVIPARVNLTHADKIFRIELFDDRVAISVLGPTDVFSVVKTRAQRLTGADAAPAASDGEGGKGVPPTRSGET